MTDCPICQRPAALIPHPYIHCHALTLARKINPTWTVSDGACRRCVESLLDTAAELEDVKAEQRPSTVSFREYYRYTLTVSL